MDLPDAAAGPLPTWPAENHVLRFFREPVEDDVSNRVVDMVEAGSDVAALVVWQPRAEIDYYRPGNFSLIRIDPLGALVFQTPVDPGAVIFTGSLLRTPEGFLVTLALRDASMQSAVVIFSFRDDGRLLHTFRYFDTGHHPARSVGLASLGDGGFLLGATLPTGPTHFVVLDAAMVPVPGRGCRFDEVALQRLRRTPRFGIFAVGWSRLPEGAGGWVLNFDPANGKPRWQRRHRLPAPTPQALTWTDFAEGNDSLLVVGYLTGGAPGRPLGAVIASLEKSNLLDPRLGAVRWAKKTDPDPSGYPPHLDGLAFRQLGMVEGPPWARCAACGSTAERLPWLLLFDENGAIDWQKTLLRDRRQGLFAGVVWPSYDEIVAGGTCDDRPGNPHALVASSKAVPRSGSLLYCSQPAAVPFVALSLTAENPALLYAPYNAGVSSWPYGQVAAQKILPGCPQ